MESLDSEPNQDNLSMIANITELPGLEDFRDSEETLSAEETATQPNRRDSEETLTAEEIISQPERRSSEETISADEPIPENHEENDTAHTSHEDPIQQISVSEKPLNNYDHQIIMDFVHHSPANPKTKQIFPNKKRLYVQISKNNLENDIINFFKNYAEPKFTYAIHFKNEQFVSQICNILRTTFKNSAYKLVQCNIVLDDITEKDRQTEIIRNYHEGKTNHRGITETEARIRRSYYWPGIKKDISDYINICDICQTNKYDRNPPTQKLMISPTPSKPFEIVHLDTFQALGQKFLTIIDTFSKYAQAYPLTNLSGIDIVKSLLIFMTHHGLPTLVIMDNGTELKNSVVQEFLKTHQVNIHYITTNNPQSNGAIERFHSTIIEHLRVIKEKTKGKFDILNQMPYAILGYNNSIHSVTKQKPMDIINGHLNTKDPFDININEKLINNYIQEHRETTKEIYRNLNEKLTSHKEHTIEKHNEKRQDPLDYEPNTNVYRKITSNVRNKLYPKFSKETVLQNQHIKVKTKRRKYHKQNLKRPKTNKTKTLQVTPDGASDNIPRSENNKPRDKPGTTPV